MRLLTRLYSMMVKCVRVVLPECSEDWCAIVVVFGFIPMVLNVFLSCSKLKLCGISKTKDYIFNYMSM